MDRRTNRSSRSWAVALIICLVAMALSYALALISRNVFSYSGFGSFKPVNIANLQDLNMVDDGFVYYDGSTVSAISSAGKVKWSYLIGANAQFESTNSGTAAWQDRTITLIDKSGTTTYNGTMEQTILSAKVGPRYTAICTGTQTDPMIVLMENGGRQVNHIHMDNVAVVDYGFFSEGTLLWAMVCDTNGTVPICRIQTYKPGKEIVGSIADNEQLDYAVLFQSSKICVAGDTYLKTYDYTGIEDLSRRTMIYGWNLVHYDNSRNDPLLALTNDAQYRVTDGVQDVRVLRSDLDFIVRMPFGCSYVMTNGDNVYGFSTDGHIMTFSTQDRVVKAYPTNIRIDKVYGVTRDDHAVISSNGAIALVDLNQ